MLAKLKNRLGNRKGFTLIELIVVIAIIAILAAVLIPRFAGFTENARKNAVTSDARNILLAVEALNTQGTAYTAIVTGDIEKYAGKTYFSAGSCSNWTITGTEFSFYDKQGDKYYKATVTMATSGITVADGIAAIPGP